MTTVVEFVLGSSDVAWRSVGFAVNDSGTVQVGGIRCRFDGNTSTPGIASWALADANNRSATSIDGLATSHLGAPDAITVTPTHPNGVVGIDHVVVNTPDLERTCSAMTAATGAPLKRVREVGALRQGFHRLGELIVEVVTFPGISPGDASFWGLALNVSDIDAMFDTYGPDVLSPPKDAVQQGRRISSFREQVGLGLPVALMTSQPR